MKTKVVVKVVGFLTYVLFFCNLAFSAISETPEDTVTVAEGDVTLPCRASTGDSVTWYDLEARSGSRSLFFVSRDLGVLRQNNDEKYSNFYVNYDNQQIDLYINETAKEDEGIYTCALSSESIPTTGATLSVVVNASSIEIDMGLDAESDGSYYLNTSLSYNVSCAALGSNPVPVLTWYFDEDQIDDQYATKNTYVYRNTTGDEEDYTYDVTSMLYLFELDESSEDVRQLECRATYENVFPYSVFVDLRTEEYNSAENILASFTILLINALLIITLNY